MILLVYGYMILLLYVGVSRCWWKSELFQLIVQAIMKRSLGCGGGWLHPY
jgi:hypothetical protein